MDKKDASIYQKYKECFDAGMTQMQTAERLGVTRQAVSYYANSHGMSFSKARKRKAPRPKKKKEIKAAYLCLDLETIFKKDDEYITAREICDGIGISYMTFHRWQNKPELMMPRPVWIKGVRHFSLCDIKQWLNFMRDLRKEEKYLEIHKMTEKERDQRDLAILRDFDAGIDAASLIDKYGVTVDHIQVLILEAYKHD